MRTLAPWIVLLSTAATLTAQREEYGIAERMFGEHFVAARRAAHASEADFRRVHAELDRAAEFVPELAPARRPAAAFGVGVARAEVFVFEQKDREARDLLQRVRAEAKAAGVWEGRYRELADVLLWNLDPVAFDAIWDEEREFLASRESSADGPLERMPLAVVRLSRELSLRAGERAIRAERELLELAASAPNGKWRDKAHGVLVWYFLMRRDLRRAQAYIDLLPEDVGRVLRARIALSTGRYDEAARQGRILAETDPSLYQIVGDAHEMAGEFHLARQAYEKAREANLTEAERVVVLRGLGDCAYGSFVENGEPNELLRARHHYDEAVERLGNLDAGGYLDAEDSQLEVCLGRMAEAEGDAIRALRHYRTASRKLARLRSRVGANLFGGSQLAIDDLDAVEGVLRTFRSAGESAISAFAAMESAKARTLLDWIKDPPRDYDDTAARELTSAMHRLAVDSSLANQRDVEQSLLDVAVVFEQAEPLDAAGVEEHVRAWPGVAFLSYWLGRESLWVAWARDGRAGLIELGRREEAEFALAGARAAVASPQTSYHAPLAVAGATFVIRPELLDVIRGARRIVFCPDEELGALPFEAIQLDATPLGVEYAVERTPSLSVRAELARRSSRGSAFAVVHSVAGVDRVEEQFELQPLEHSAVEADYFARAYGDVESLHGADATLGELRDLLARGPFDVVHVSAHVVVAAVPTATMLVLADAPASIATLASMPLHGALLVLSACSSATGDARAGEGEIGLLGWPLAAGARGAIASTWAVNQQATKDLMGQFHAARAEGYDTVDAMREARAVLSSAEQYEHPHYWAGFGVYAAPPIGRGLGWAGWIAGVALTVGLAGWWALRRKPG